MVIGAPTDDLQVDNAQGAYCRDDHLTLFSPSAPEICQPTDNFLAGSPHASPALRIVAPFENAVHKEANSPK